MRDLRVTLPDQTDGPVEAVRGIDLDVAAGETIGQSSAESGSGKSQATMANQGLLASNCRARQARRYAGRS